jgi:hypothetical protein
MPALLELSSSVQVVVSEGSSSSSVLFSVFCGRGEVVISATNYNSLELPELQGTTE